MSEEFKVGDTVETADGRRGVVRSFIEVANVEGDDGCLFSRSVNELAKVDDFQEGDRVSVWKKYPGTVKAGPFRSSDDRYDHYVVLSDQGAHTLVATLNMKRLSS